MSGKNRPEEVTSKSVGTDDGSAFSAFVKQLMEDICFGTGLFTRRFMWLPRRVHSDFDGRDKPAWRWLCVAYYGPAQDRSGRWIWYTPNTKVRDARAESGASPSVEAPTE